MHNKQNFPALINSDVAYLDSASSTQKPSVVIDRMSHVMSSGYANIHRGLYKWSQDLTLAYEATRKNLANFINAYSENEIIFTSNATESVNLVAQSWGRANLCQGDEVIISAMEHHANIVPWQLLRDQIGIVLKIIPVMDDGTLDLNEFKALLSAKTKMVSIVHISNATGVVNDIETVIKTAKSYNKDIKILIDASQSIVHRPIDVHQIGCDFMVFTGHKMYGPTGVGVLWAHEDILNSMPPYKGGGDMIDVVRFDETTYKKAPARFEAGTPAIAEVIGLGQAIDFIQAIGFDTIQSHEREMTRYLKSCLDAINGLEILGAGNDNSEHAGIYSFNLKGIHTSDVAMVLDQMNVAVRTGHHCCMPLMQRFNVEGTIRASIGLYTSKNDIDKLGQALIKAQEMLL